MTSGGRWFGWPSGIFFIPGLWTTYRDRTSVIADICPTSAWYRHTGYGHFGAVLGPFRLMNSIISLKFYQFWPYNLSHTFVIKPISHDFIFYMILKSVQNNLDMIKFYGVTHILGAIHIGCITHLTPKAKNTNFLYWFSAMQTPTLKKWYHGKLAIVWDY